MEETNVTMSTEEMQGEPAAKENETKAEKFIRIGEYRMNKAVDALGRLENLANCSSYEYTQYTGTGRRYVSGIRGEGCRGKIKVCIKKSTGGQKFQLWCNRIIVTFNHGKAVMQRSVAAFLSDIANIERAIKDVIDPEQNHGEGDGMAPMCHNVLIQLALTQSIAVKATIEFDTG